LTCEYGNDPNIACNSVFVCAGAVGSTSWRSVAPEAGATCPTTIPALDPTCPKTVPSGLCDDASTPLCHYATGYCTCIGTSSDRHWGCDSQDPKCPHPRPSLGTPCDEDNLRCYYLDCNVPWGTALICNESTWHVDPTAPCAP
jgi:hypothetical protein